MKLLEETPYKKLIQLPKERSSEALAGFMKYAPSDIFVEEEEIGDVVERIYTEGRNLG